MPNITEAKIQIDVYNRGVDERVEKIADDVPVRRSWTISLQIVGGMLTLPISSSDFVKFREFEDGALLRMSAIYTTNGTRRQFRNIELEPLPPHTAPAPAGYLRGNFRGQIESYEKNSEIIRNLILQSFGSQIQLRDEQAFVQFNQLQNKDCFRVEASFTFDTRWRQGSNGKYQTLDPVFYNVSLTDIPAGSSPEGRRREREREKPEQS